MKTLKITMIAGASFLAGASPAWGQGAVINDSEEPAFTSNDIIVTARRRDESVQDVPLVVQAVTAQELAQLNIRDFKDIQSLVPGLNISTTQNGIQSATTLRGVNFDVTASGNNGTVEFYLDDSPISAGLLFTAMFDIGQIEVLRGPQGTLRGRASPSGSITVTTRRPDLSQAGGYMIGTINDIGGWNVNGAINVPVIEDKLAVRVAGLLDENDDNDVSSINNSLDPFSKTQGIRASVLFEPVDFLTTSLSYTGIDRKRRSFDQFESAEIADPTLPAGPVFIEASDRLSVMRAPRTTHEIYKIFNWQAELRLAGQKLNYVGSHKKQQNFSEEPADRGAVYGPGFPDRIYQAGLGTFVHSNTKSHEIRLSSDERIAGIFDYVAGYLWNKADNPTDLTSDTLVWFGPPQPSLSNLLAEVITPIFRFSGSKEESVFGNITAHITDATEISGGIRHIKYKTDGALAIGTTTNISAPTAVSQDLDATIYSASLKHRFSDSFMAYASFGTSWRAGGTTNATLLREFQITPFLRNLLIPDPEKSKSYEVGIKTDLLDRRLRLNVSAYHQTFDNFQYFQRSLFVAGSSLDGAPRVEQTTGLAVGVPAKVDGVEAELQFQASDRWSLGAVASYAKSKVKNGSVPCNDFYDANGNVGSDGIPDSQTPNFADIMAATDGNGMAFCQFSGRAGLAAPFTATLQSEYNHSLSSNMDGYVRGLVSYFGKSQNDPLNPIDDISAYALVNLFAGVRDPDGGWEVGGYVKNLFDTGRILIREANPNTVEIRSPAPATVASSYRTVSYTAPREFGVTARISFGSR